MFCFQCEQTAKGTGCTVQGVCGKDAQTADLQDLLVYQTKQIGAWAHQARRLGPSLPACLTPAILKILVEQFSIIPITTATEDLQAILGTDQCKEKKD